MYNPQGQAPPRPAKRTADTLDHPPTKRPHQDDKAHVRRHYNSQQNLSHKDRRGSEILGVRNFNNLIKAILIDRYAEKRSLALDLACGKGGDLQKWDRASISGLMGVDIAEVSTQQARERFNNMTKRFWTDFAAGDAFSTPIREIFARGDPEALAKFPKVDIVSCQFALHYAFGSEDQARSALENVSQALNKNGSFIGTIPNADYLSAQLKKHGQEWGNSKFKIKFEKPNPEGVFDPPYGHKYCFNLMEAVENVPEYVVRIDTFKALAEEYGLRCELFKPFQEFFYDSITNHDIKNAAIRKRLLDRFNPDRITISKDELEAVSVYSVFMFRKVRNID